MSPWKSRWSRVRLVKTATLNSQPYTRSRAREWDETSSTAWVQEATTISRKSCWRSDASGVVRTASDSRSPMRYCTVPRRPAVYPAARSAASMR